MAPCLTGCVLPTQLNEEPPTTNFPPVFTFADPAFGLLTITGDNPLRELKLRAVDPNAEDETLYVRLFLSMGGAARFYTGHETTLTLPAGTMTENIPTTDRFGSFFGPSGLPLCDLFPNGGDLFAVVSDRVFSDGAMTAGLTSENHWDLSCPQQ